MYELKFKNHNDGTTTRKLFDTLDDAYAAMVRDWEDHLNGFVGDDDFLADHEAERDSDEWRNYCEECGNEYHAVLAHLDEDGPSYEWWVREAKKFYVEFSIRICECRVIAATSEEEAKEIADEMLYDRQHGDDYWEDICQSMDNDYENFRKKYCEIEVVDEAPEEYEADNEEH